MTLMKDGYQTLIEFSAADSGFYLRGEEQTLTPAGLDGGGPIDTTTMRNSALRTMQPKQLITTTPASIDVLWDPALYADVYAMVNTNQQLTFTFPDGSTAIFWGFINTFSPQQIQEGQPALCTIGFQPTNENNSGVETAPSGTAFA